jgi:DNA-binding NtrC family response regulator
MKNSPSSFTSSVLIVDDDKNTLIGMTQFLARSDREIFSAGSAEEALREIGSHPVNILISDIRLPGMNGIQLMEEVLKTYPETDVILMTGYGSIEDAVKAMQKGAETYLTKPLHPEELEIVLNRIIRKQELIRQNRELLKRLNGTSVESTILGTSEGIRKVLKTAREVAPADVPVLIQGETGTGKELVARMIHRLSTRSDGPFVIVNCAALNENLLESELFGHEKGAFTGAVKQKKGRFEIADGGTLFLDEIGEMQLSTQSKILRTLEYGTFERLGGTRSLHAHVRILSATNRDLNMEIHKGTFREDLFFRLNVLTITIPPLKDRKEDIEILAGVFLKRFAAGQKKAIEGFSREVQTALLAYNWPGNVRELEHVIERAVILCSGSFILPEHLPEQLQDLSSYALNPRDILIPVGTSLREAEKKIILKTLKQFNYSRTKTAGILGISSRKIAYLLKKWKMEGLGKRKQD